MRTILTTVGTSLLTNLRRDQSVARPGRQHLVRYLRQTPPERACAETNSLTRLVQEGDRIIFLHSQTDEGRLCAEALASHYEGQRFSTRLQEVADLTYAENRFKLRGLRSLVATMIALLRQERAQGREVLINATGGFKAEIAYATLVGLLFDVPVYYIHEAFRDIIAMPPAPISWDYTIIADHDEFFEWLHENFRLSREVEARLRHLPSEIHLLLAEEEGYTFLSPAGEAFYEAYLEQLTRSATVPLFLSEEAHETYKKASPAIQTRFARALEKLRLITVRRNRSDRVRNSDCLVYPKGHCDERIFYFEDEEGRVMVCLLTRHSDRSYERAIERGVYQRHFHPFHPWP